MWLDIIKYNRHSLKHAKIQDEDIICAAVKNTHQAAEFIKPELMTYDLCVKIIENNMHVLDYVPKNFQTYEICMNVIKSCGYLLSHV